MDVYKVGMFIANKRKEKGYTQQELGEKLFVTDKAVSCLLYTSPSPRDA